MFILVFFYTKHILLKLREDIDLVGNWTINPKKTFAIIVTIDRVK